MIRRVVVASLAVALLVGMTMALSALLGDDPQTATPTVTSPPVAPDPVGETGVPAPVETTPPPTPEVHEPFVPTADRKAKLLIIGDSDAGTFGPYLQRLVKKFGVVDTELDYKVSSGLSRPDFYDWPARIEEDLATIQPDIVVVTFGGNDGQGLTNKNKGVVARLGTDKWRTEYAARVAAVTEMIHADGRSLIWVGIPNGPSNDFTERLTVQNEVVQTELAKYQGVVFIDTWNRFVGIDGGWAEFVIDPRDGEGKDVRAKDGFHLNETGAEILALDIARAVKADLRARGAAI